MQTSLTRCVKVFSYYIVENAYYFIEFLKLGTSENSQYL